MHLLRTIGRVFLKLKNTARTVESRRKQCHRRRPETGAILQFKDQNHKIRVLSMPEKTKRLSPHKEISLTNSTMTRGLIRQTEGGFWFLEQDCNNSLATVEMIKRLFTINDGHI